MALPRLRQVDLDTSRARTFVVYNGVFESRALIVADWDGIERPVDDLHSIREDLQANWGQHVEKGGYY